MANLSGPSDLFLSGDPYYLGPGSGVGTANSTISAGPQLPGATIGGGSYKPVLSGAPIGISVGGPSSSENTNPAGAIPQGATLNQPNAQTAPAPGSSSGISSGTVADYFARTIIVVLGFIFVAIGLNMLRPGTVPVVPHHGI